MSSALAFCTTVLVSRLLTPHEVGVFVVALSIAGLVAALQNFGTKEFIVQNVGLDDSHRRAAFGVSLLAGLTTSSILLALSVPIARLYDTEGLAAVIAILAVNPLLNSLGAPVSAMFARERLFPIVAAISVISAAASTTTAVTLSYFGFSFYSLAFASLAATLISLIGHWTFGRRFVVVHPTLRGAGVVFSFGMKVYAANALSAVQNASDGLIIGKALGLSSAAMFQRAGAVGSMYVQFVNKAVDEILTAEYAAHNRMGGDIARAFLSATRHMSAIAWPFFSAMAIYADPAVRVLFGGQWTAAIVPMQILCIACLFFPLNTPAIGVVVGTGAVDLNLRIRIITSLVRVAMTLVAALHSLNAVAGTVVISAILMWVAYTLAARSRAAFTVRSYLHSLMPSATTSIVAVTGAAAGYLIGQGLGLSSLPLVLLGAAATTLGWVTGLFVSKHPLFQELQLITKRGVAALRPS